MGKQLKSTRNNIIGRFTLEQLIVGIIFLAVAAHTLTLSMDYGVMDRTPIGILFVLLTLVIILLYRAFFWKESTLYNSIAMLKYGLDYVTGNTKLRKYSCTAAQLKTKLPIDEVHENGMIEFPGKQFGVLLELYLPNVEDAGQAMFLIRNVELLNSLPEDVLYKAHEFSHIDIEKHLLEQIKTAINDPGTTEEMKKHLYASYDEMLKVPGKVIWDGYGFIGVGKYKNADKAFIESTINVEVVLSGLMHANILPHKITDAYTILRTYRQLISMKKVV